MSSEALNHARTRSFARVIGPYVTFVTAIIVYRAPTMGNMLSRFFDNDAVVWITGGMLLISGIIIIAFHQYWRTLASVLISLFGWFLALRGAALMATPELIERGGAASVPHSDLIRAGFGALTIIGLYLTYVGWIAPNGDQASAN